MDIKDLIVNYLQKQHMMQLATEADSQPWICTLYYSTDDSLNLYWLSLPSRRHSKELEAHSNVAATIPVNFMKGEKVVGIQVQGQAERLMSGHNSKPYIDNYASKFNRTKQWVDDFCNDKTDHKLYKLTPKLFVLFDENNYPGQPRQEFSLI